jgi:cytidylate kinase
MIPLKEKITIAIDGYSSCGKSSYAKLIARELNYLYLDSGAMYRAVALYGLRKEWIKDKTIRDKELINSLGNVHINFVNKAGENTTYLNNENVEHLIRGGEVSAVVSGVSRIPEVRKHLVLIQQEMGMNKGIVMDGRDIGTVVFPDAEIKIFMKANVEVRAKRRFDELIEKGLEADLEAIRKNIEERDYLDIHRSVSPLRQADDAQVLDNSNMTFSDQMDWFRSLLLEKDLIMK